MFRVVLILLPRSSRTRMYIGYRDNARAFVAGAAVLSVGKWFSVRKALVQAVPVKNLVLTKAPAEITVLTSNLRKEVN